MSPEFLNLDLRENSDEYDQDMLKNMDIIGIRDSMQPMGLTDRAKTIKLNQKRML